MVSKVVALTFGALVVVIGLVWVLEYNGLMMTGFFAPRYEQVRRNTFEQSRAFNEGMQQELQRMRLDYSKGEDQEKAALRTVILQRTADYDLDMLKDPTLRSFIEQLRSGR